ncbi:MAG: hypothetical protein V9E81_02355 [Marmoricola sp.]
MQEFRPRDSGDLKTAIWAHHQRFVDVSAFFISLHVDFENHFAGREQNAAKIERGVAQFTAVFET